MNKTLIVNLYGAPGAGKSSGAAYIFYKLKQAGINAELVTEFAKDKVWEVHELAMKDSCYIFGHQHFRISRVYGKVDVIVTDSPLLTTAFYASDLYSKELTSIAYKTEEKTANSTISYFVKRVKPYHTEGRIHNESESDAISHELKEFLHKLGIVPFEINGDLEGYDKVVDDIKRVFEKKDLAKDENTYQAGDFTIKFSPEQMEELVKWKFKIIENNLSDGWSECSNHQFSLQSNQINGREFEKPVMFTNGQYIIVMDGDKEIDYIGIMKWLNCWK